VDSLTDTAAEAIIFLLWCVYMIAAVLMLTVVLCLLWCKYFWTHCLCTHFKAHTHTRTHTHTHTRTHTQVIAVDRSSSTIIAAVHLLDALSVHMGPDATAARVLPMLCPLLVLPALSGRQFKDVMAIIQVRVFYGSVCVTAVCVCVLQQCVCYNSVCNGNLCYGSVFYGSVFYSSVCVCVTAVRVCYNSVCYNSVCYNSVCNGNLCYGSVLYGSVCVLRQCVCVTTVFVCYNSVCNGNLCYGNVCDTAVCFMAVCVFYGGCNTFVHGVWSLCVFISSFYPLVTHQPVSSHKPA